MGPGFYCIYCFIAFAELMPFVRGVWGMLGSVPAAPEPAAVPLLSNSGAGQDHMLSGTVILNMLSTE